VLGKRGDLRVTIACDCAANWRVELVELTTGEVLNVVTPIQMEFQTSFLEPGKGSIMFHRKTLSASGAFLQQAIVSDQFVPLQNLYPRRMGIYIQRLAGGAATGEVPVPMFAGIVESFRGEASGVVTLGFTEIQSYLNYRTIRSDLTFTAVNQTLIGANLVDYARQANTLGGSTDPLLPHGIQLFGASVANAPVARDRTYLAQDRQFLGQMITQLTGVIDGPVYRMSHVRSGGVWTSTQTFYDEIPQTVIKVISEAEVTDFGITYDGNSLANLIDAYGRPADDGTPLIVTEDYSGLIFDIPRYDATPSFPTVSDPVELQENAQGYQRDHSDVAAIIPLSFSGLEYGPALTIDDLVPGDEVYVDIGTSEWRILADGSFADNVIARLGSVSVSLPQEGAEAVTTQVTIFGVDNMTTADGVFPCRDC
jgi:hypothetical protein